MDFTNKQLRSFATNLICSGTLGVISFIQFYFTYELLVQPLETFWRFFRSGNLDKWAQNHIFDLEPFAITIAMLTTCAISATIGLFAATFAKHFHSKALDVLQQKTVI